MSETKTKGRYFYLMLKENFYDSDDMVLLESMENGYKYSNILLKLYLKSLKDKGKLMYKDRIPYSIEMLAKLTRHDPDVVRRAVEIFQQMGIIEILDNGAIFMMDIENYIGKSSTEADRRRIYDRRIAEEKRQIKLLENSCEKSCEKSHAYIDIDIELDKDINNNINNMSITEAVNGLEDAFITIILNDKTEYPITNELLEEYKKLYPAVNVEQELRKYAAWALSNPTKRKTRRGILRSINLWLSRVQDQGGANVAVNRRSTKKDGSEFSMYD